MEERVNNTAVLAEDLADDLEKSTLTFYVGEILYSFPLVNVLDIIGMQPIASVPGTPPYVKGVINLRGAIVPVVDIRLKFGKEEREYDELTSIVITDVNNMRVGVIVDRVSKVHVMEEISSTDLPEFNTVNTNMYIKSITRIDGEIVMNLDCEKILEDDNILDML